MRELLTLTNRKVINSVARERINVVILLGGGRGHHARVHYLAWAGWYRAALHCRVRFDRQARRRDGHDERHDFERSVGVRIECV